MWQLCENFLCLGKVNCVVEGWAVGVCGHSDRDPLWRLPHTFKCSWSRRDWGWNEMQEIRYWAGSPTLPVISSPKLGNWLWRMSVFSHKTWTEQTRQQFWYWSPVEERGWVQWGWDDREGQEGTGFHQKSCTLLREVLLTGLLCTILFEQRPPWLKKKRKRKLKETSGSFSLKVFACAKEWSTCGWGTNESWKYKNLREPFFHFEGDYRRQNVLWLL